MPTFSRRLIASILLGLVLVLLLLGSLSRCAHLATAGKEARVAKGQAEASVEAGAEAMNTISNVAAADAATDRAVKESTDEIRSAPAGNSNAAAERAACRLRQYRDSQRCARLRAADPGEPAR